VFLFRTGDQKIVPASVSAENGKVTLKPSAPLDPLTNYTFYITGAVKDVTGSYQAPMFIVGVFMLISAALAFAIGSTARRSASDAAVPVGLEAHSHTK